MQSRSSLAVAALVVAMAGGCRRSAEVTGVRIVVNFTSAVQIEFSVASGQDQLAPAVKRPDPPRGPLASPADVVFYLPDELADTDVTCTARVIQQDSNVSETSSAVAHLRLHDIVTVTLKTGADGGVDQNVPWDGAPRPLGDACNRHDECETGYCIDGVCCESSCGTCQQCNAPGKYGTCAYAAAGRDTGDCPDDGITSCGRDGKCDGNGGCRLYQVGTQCQLASCDYPSGGYRPPSTCDGLGHCLPSASVTCAPYRCNDKGCINSCTIDSDCVSGSCSGSQCSGATLKALGQACTDTAECVNGAVCADGVCCKSACTDPCKKCDATGTCAPVAAGAPDPRNSCTKSAASTCGLDGTCDGAGQCRKWPAGTSCASWNVRNTCGTQTLRSRLYAYQCNGAGTCASVTVDCAPYTCVTPGTYSQPACTTSCTSATECAPMIQCSGGLCGGVPADAGAGG